MCFPAILPDNRISFFNLFVQVTMKFKIISLFLPGCYSIMATSTKYLYCSSKIWSDEGLACLNTCCPICYLSQGIFFRPGINGYVFETMGPLQPTHVRCEAQQEIEMIVCLYQRQTGGINKERLCLTAHLKPRCLPAIRKTQAFTGQTNK